MKREITRDSLEFQDGKLVKIHGMRIQYIDGYEMQRVIQALGGIIIEMEIKTKTAGA